MGFFDWLGGGDGAGGGGGAGLDAIADRIFALEAHLNADLEELIELLFNHWDTALSTMNNGQTEITMTYLWPWVNEWIAMAAEEWPWVYADDYAWGCYDAYDEEVVDRAFSMTVWDPVEHMWGIIDQAQTRQMLIEALMSIV